jgi:hypothetical protein
VGTVALAPPRHAAVPRVSADDDLLGDDPGSGLDGPATIAGIEQEYGVRIDGSDVDFADLIDRVAPRTAIRRVPHDPQARFLASGAILTADSPQAEVATPPRHLGPGVAGRLAADALVGREHLLQRLRVSAPGPGRVEVRGYSTHLNAACPGEIEVGWRVVHRYVRTFAPALMLLADRTGSPGLLVRPRPDRLEAGTDFLETRDDLVAATLFFLASTIGTWEAELADEQPILAPLDDGRVVETWQRPGLFVDRAAFGGDLYRLGRSARLALADGGWERAGDRLEQAWGAVRSIAAGFATPDELAIVDDLVDARRPLPLERGAPIEPLVRRQHRAPQTRPGPHVPVLRRLATGKVTTTPVSITWGSTLLRVAHPDRDFYVRIPRESSADFASRFVGGALDASIATVASRPSTGLSADPYDDRPGVFDAAPAPWPADAGRRKSGGPVPPGKARRPKSTSGPRSATPLVRAPAPVPHGLPGSPAPSPMVLRSPWWRRPRTVIAIVTLVLIGLIPLVRAGLPGQPVRNEVLPGCPAGVSGAAGPSGVSGAAGHGCPTPGLSPGTETPAVPGSASPTPSCLPAVGVGGCPPPTAQGGLPSPCPDLAAVDLCPSGSPVTTPSPAGTPGRPTPRPGASPCLPAVGSASCPTPRPSPSPTSPPTRTPSPSPACDPATATCGGPTPTPTPTPPPPPPPTPPCDPATGTCGGPTPPPPPPPTPCIPTPFTGCP